LAPHGVRVNVLAPSGMVTPMVHKVLQAPDGQAADFVAELSELAGPLLLACDVSS
jgi:NAD(P)-dependent dehydrogenase (short-subunit alcohol dehydrogenase family)